MNKNKLMQTKETKYPIRGMRKKEGGNMDAINCQSGVNVFEQIVEDAIRMRVANVFVDGVTAAQAIGVSYSTFRRWCECRLVKGVGCPVKYSLSDVLFLDVNMVRKQYRMLNK